MTSRSELTAMLVQVAHLYYNEGLSQIQIAERLGVSRSLIALYLQRAREQGIVRIEVINPQDHCVELALSLTEKTGISHITVVPSSPAAQSDTLTAQALATAAAQHLRKTLKDGDVLGIGWGRTMSKVVDMLPPAPSRDLIIIPLLGETSAISSYTQINQMVLQAAQAFQAKPHFLLAPMLVGSRKLRDALFDDMVVRQVAAYWDHLTVVCFGIGVMPPTPGMIVYVGEEHTPMLQAQGAVGDICAHYFDQRGQLIQTELDELMIGVNWDQLRRARRAVGVAYGVEKTAAILAALNSGLISDLFIDEKLAESMLQTLEQAASNLQHPGLK